MKNVARQLKHLHIGEQKKFEREFLYMLPECYLHEDVSVTPSQEHLLSRQ